MRTVFLIYEDDYGGMFSPYVLTHVFETKDEAENYKNGSWLVRIIEHPKREDSNYPKHNGGLF